MIEHTRFYYHYRDQLEKHSNFYNQKDSSEIVVTRSPKQTTDEIHLFSECIDKQALTLVANITGNHFQAVRLKKNMPGFIQEVTMMAIDSLPGDSDHHDFLANASPYINARWASLLPQKDNLRISGLVLNVGTQISGFECGDFALQNAKYLSRYGHAIDHFLAKRMPQLLSVQEEQVNELAPISGGIAFTR